MLANHVHLENATELGRRLAQVCGRVPGVKRDIAHDRIAIFDLGRPVGSPSNSFLRFYCKWVEICKSAGRRRKFGEKWLEKGLGVASSRYQPNSRKAIQ